MIVLLTNEILIGVQRNHLFNHFCNLVFCKSDTCMRGCKSAPRATNPQPRGILPCQGKMDAFL